MKTTKKALLSSVLCIVLCLSMLVGTTFAWFTDSVTTGANKIQSGILKIDLQHVTENGSVSLKEHPDHEVISSDILWEPGYTALATLRIVNKGNLALKYILSLNVEADAVNKKLAEVIDVYTLVGQMGEGRPDLTDTKTWNKVGSLYELITKTGGAANGILLPKGATPKAGKEDVEIVEAIETTFVLHMREDAGNEYQNLNLGAVYMNLFATQYTYEEDSFDDQYDADQYDHYVMTFEDLKAAYAAGGSILVLNDIEWKHMLTVEADKEIYLDLNGNKMTASDEMAASSNDYFMYTYEGSKITITGNGTFDLEDHYAMNFMLPCGDVVIEDGYYIRNRIPEGTVAAVLFMGMKNCSGTVVINGGYFDSGYYDKNAELDFYETADDIAKRGVSSDKNLIRVALKNNITKTLNMSYNKILVYGGTFVGMNPAWGDEGCMLPTTPNYLRPWSYYQGAFLDGQEYCADGIKLPEGYSIAESEHRDGRPVYTVSYSE